MSKVKRYIAISNTGNALYRKMKCIIWCILSSLLVQSARSEVNQMASEANPDNGDVFIIVAMCIVFCFAIRHANDFYSGETVTLVEEGVWGGRFRHRGEYKYLSHIENDFQDMINTLKEKEDTSIYRE